MNVDTIIRDIHCELESFGCGDESVYPSIYGHVLRLAEAVEFELGTIKNRLDAMDRRMDGIYGMLETVAKSAVAYRSY